MSEFIRILIADDHLIVRKGLRALLKVKPGLKVVGEAQDGNEAVCKAQELQPDVIIIDLVMPNKDGITAIREIKQNIPNARILVFTSFSNDERVFASIKAGALGYLLKDSSHQELLQAIETVYKGKPYISPVVTLKIMNNFSNSSELRPPKNPLTTREIEVLKLVAEGLSNKEISMKLSISQRTVGHHVSNILAKLNLANRTQMVLYALREGLTSVSKD